MRRNRAAVLLSAALLTGCGVPSSGGVEVWDQDPVQSDQEGPAEQQYVPTDDSESTVKNFLHAAAGSDVDRQNRLDAFTEEPENYSNPADGIGIIDVAATGYDGRFDDTSHATVEVTGRRTGTYLPDGRVRTNPDPAEYNFTFELEREDYGDTWTIVDVPTDLVMLRDAFHELYESSPVYFEATGGGSTNLLVPDLRWIYKNPRGGKESLEKRFSWVLQGPSDLVSQTARNAIPSGVSADMTVEDDVVAVDLTRTDSTTEIDPGKISAIAAQLVWSLGLNSAAQPLELSFDGGDTRAAGTIDNWRSWNAVPSPSGSDEAAFYIQDGTVYQYDNNNTHNSTPSPVYPWVGFHAEGLTAVAVEDQRLAAVIGDGLYTSSWSDPANDLVPVLKGKEFSHPQWLDSKHLLCIVDGRLSLVNVVDGTDSELSQSPVTDVAVSAEKRRVAYVSNGKVFLAPIIFSGDSVSLGSPTRIAYDIGDVTSVAWASESNLWIAGAKRDLSPSIHRQTIDGAEGEQKQDAIALEFTDLAARQADPTDPQARFGEPLVGVANGRLMRSYTSTLVDLEGTEGAQSPFVVLQGAENTAPK
ncbi:LpqB family beta-propeller domain-containing protein [Salininema proteolyticum]|uniref:LpqB family beta-propeller domain-containing protein n=1 Tax=Salininema proteolyticum TaxID=1607685 RepID=A0ABV8TZT4_9ACTN